MVTFFLWLIFRVPQPRPRRFFYDRVIFPLFTKGVYADKNVQEGLLETSGLDWTILRPAPFGERPARDDFQAITRIMPDTVSRRVTRSEVAAFVPDQIGDDGVSPKKGVHRTRLNAGGATPGPRAGSREAPRRAIDLRLTRLSLKINALGSRQPWTRRGHPFSASHISSRTSVNRPVIAAAAAMPGDRRCVRPL